MRVVAATFAVLALFVHASEALSGSSLVSSLASRSLLEQSASAAKTTTGRPRPPLKLKSGVKVPTGSDLLTLKDVELSYCTQLGGSCSLNEYAMLHEDVPEPKTDGEKFFAKWWGTDFACALHKSESDCKNDKKNGCEVGMMTTTDNQQVKVCQISDEKWLEIYTEYGFCKGAFAEKYFKCVENEPSSCPSDASGVKCQQIKHYTGEQLCYPADANKYNYNVANQMGATQLAIDLVNGSDAFWGSCPGKTLLATSTKCLLTGRDRASCPSPCMWDSSMAGMAGAAGVCYLPDDAASGMMLKSSDTGKSFTNYLQEASNKCKAFNSQTCTTQQKPLEFNKLKGDAKKYSTMSISNSAAKSQVGLMAWVMAVAMLVYAWAA